MSIRWGRGFFRAWILSAVLWIAGAVLWIETRPPPPFDPNAPSFEWFEGLPNPNPRTRSDCEEDAKKEPRFSFEDCVQTVRAENWQDAEKIAWIFVPPVLVLILGGAIGWIARGFKPPPAPPQST